MDREDVLGLLRKHEPELKAAGLLHLRLFGSVARGESTSSSDVDLVAEFADSRPLSLIAIVAIEDKLATLLGTQVHLSLSNSLRPQILDRVNQGRQCLPFSNPLSSFEDILESAKEINSFIHQMNFAAYQQDRKTKLAVERLLQILTEAAIRLGEDAEALCPGPDWRALRGMGNFLRHAYDSVDDTIVWHTVTHDLPKLQTSVQQVVTSMRTSGWRALLSAATSPKT